MIEEAKEADRWLFINDWPLRRFVLLNIFLMLVLSLFVLVRSLDPSNSYSDLGYLLVPFLLFVPGAGMMRAFRLHGTGMARSAMYSLALSLIILMSIGFFLNLLHYGGVMDDPLTLFPINLAFIASLALMTIVVMKRDSDYQAPESSSLLDHRVFLGVALALLPPFAVIMATSVTDFSGDRTLLQLVVTGLCFIPLAAMSRRIKNYDLLVLSLSVSFLLQRVLMTNFLMGYDIFSEYAAARITISNGWWNIFEYGGLQGAGANTALSVVTLAPMLDHLTGIGLIDLLKIVYPFIFSFIALAVYKAVQSQLGTGAGLMGASLLIGYQAFYGLLSQMAKQEIAEIFMVVLLLVLTESVLSRRSRRFMAAICVLGVIVSHYGMAYITIGFVGGLFFLSFLCALFKNRHPGEGFIKSTFRSLRSWWEGSRRTDIAGIYLLLFYLIIFFVWYSTTGSGIMLGFIKNSSAYIPIDTETASLSLFQFDALEFLLIDYGTPLHNMEKYLVLTAQILAVVGLVHVVMNRRTLYSKVNRDFINMGILAALLLVACYVVPRLSSMLYFARFFHLIFIFIGGFLFLGFVAIVRAFGDLFPKRIRIGNASRKLLAVCTVFVILFMLFNSGPIYSAADEYSNSFTLNKTTSWAIYSDTDVQGAKWVGLDEHRGDRIINGDIHRFTIFIGESVPSDKLRYQWTQVNTDSLVYLSTWNMEYHWIYSINTQGAKQTYTPLNDILDQLNGKYDVVYDGGGSTSVIYAPPSEPTTNPPGPDIFEYETTPMYYLGIVVVVLVSLAISVLILKRRWR